MTPIHSNIPPAHDPAVRTQGAGSANRRCIIVAHPDDEILWCGGEMLADTEADWTIVTLCRGDDPDRAPRFFRMLEQVSGRGAMGRVDDGPDQHPLRLADVMAALDHLLPAGSFDIVYTHGPRGEYTRHRRHEEVCRAVVELWRAGRIETNRLMMFAYEDGERAYLPQADASAPIQRALGDVVFARKLALITGTYGFAPDSWEARATPRVEAFWSFESADEAAKWIRAAAPPDWRASRAAEVPSGDPRPRGTAA